MENVSFMVIYSSLLSRLNYCLKNLLGQRPWLKKIRSVQFSSVAQSCPTLCDPMDCSMPGFPVRRRRACSNSCPSSRWCHPTISTSVIPFSSCLQYFPASGFFPVSQFFASGDQSIGASAWASVLPMNIQDWSPSGWTRWISLQSKGLSRIFSNTTVQKHQFFGAQLSLWPNSYIYIYTHTHTHTHTASLGLSGKKFACQCRSSKRSGFSPWVGKIPWKRKWPPTPVFLPGKFQRSLAGWSQWGHKEWDWAHMHTIQLNN